MLYIIIYTEIKKIELQKIKQLIPAIKKAEIQIIQAKNYQSLAQERNKIISNCLNNSPQTKAVEIDKGIPFMKEVF